MASAVVISWGSWFAQLWLSLLSFFGFHRVSSPGPSAPKRPFRIVIAGGSFGGLAVCRHLAAHVDDMEVTLIEPKEFVEYTPGILKAVVDPVTYLDLLQLPLLDCVPKGVRIWAGYLHSILSDAAQAGGVAVCRPVGGGAHVSFPFDAIVIATGSIYPPPSKAHPEVRERNKRNTSLLHANVDMYAAQHVVVVGAGPVGVELAAELRCRWPSKRITVVQAGECLLTGLPRPISDAASQWFADNDIEVLYNQKVATHDSVYDPEPLVEVKYVPRKDRGGTPSSASTSASTPTASGSVHSSSGAVPDASPASNPRRRGLKASASESTSTPQSFLSDATPTSSPTSLRSSSGYHTSQTHDLVTDAGMHIQADFVFYCVGTHPQSDFMLRSATHLVPARQGDGRVAVDDKLRVVGGEANGVFAVGDLVLHPYVREPLLAYTAEKHAECVGDNLVAMACGRGESLHSYPECLTGVKSSPQIMCISLGPYRSLLAFNGMHIVDPWVGQRAAAILKVIIERTKVWQLGNRRAGLWFWAFADWVSARIHGFVPLSTAPLAT